MFRRATFATTVLFVLVAFLPGCSLGTASGVLSSAKQATQATTPTTQTATQKEIRTIVQAAGQATAPWGPLVLGLVSGISGLLLAGIQTYRKTISDAANKSALAEVASKVSDVSTLSQATQRKLHAAQHG